MADALVDEFDGLALPGGTVNPDKLRLDDSAVSFVRDFVISRKPVAAICHGPWTLVEAGVAVGRTPTTYPSIRTDLRNAGAHVLDEEVVVDGNVITSRPPKDLPAFCETIVKQLASAVDRFNSHIRGHYPGQAVIATAILERLTEGPTLTTIYPEPTISVAHNVYQPQEDSRLLVDAMQYCALISGRRILDLCTGSGFVAIAAAEMGCASVAAFDICPHAVRCSRGNAVLAGVEIDVREGSWLEAVDCAPFDVVVANPPYVPTPPGDDSELLCPSAGPSWAWNAGPDGRLVLDPLCESTPKLLCDGGSLLLVHSAIAGVRQSLDRLKWAGMEAVVIATKWIPFGPVMLARAKWLEDTGRIPRGRREEELVVIRADKP